MGTFVTDLFIWVFLILSIILILGLISPRLISKIVRGKWSRKKIALVFISAIFVSLIIVGISSPNDNNGSVTNTGSGSNNNSTNSSNVNVKKTSIIKTTQTVTKTPTPTATTTPNPTKTPTPTPTATSTPIQTTVASTPIPSLNISITQSAGTVSPGDYATESIDTSAGAYCTIEVDYMSGPSTAQGLTSQTANESGDASWTWKVGTRTTPGSWPIYINCSLNGISKQVQDSVNVQ